MIRGDEAKFELTLSFDELTLIYKSLMAAKSLGILSQEDEFVDDTIEFIIDDNPHKRGLYMPGSHLPIVASSALLEHDITLCLLSLNPIGEENVIAKNAAFAEHGGTFASIFPASVRALKV